MESSCPEQMLEHARLGRKEVMAAWGRPAMRVTAGGGRGCQAQRNHSLFTLEEGHFLDALKFSTSFN